MSVRIVIDSASDITKERADSLNLDFLPLKTIFGEEEFLDGITITHREFYEKLIECGTVPTTSQISPYDYEQKFKEIKESGDTAVVICLSSLLSGTYQSACIAAEGYEDCICLVDSLNVCIGEQNLIMYAVRLREQGLSAPEIAALLNHKKHDICLVAVFDTLEYLKQGGRISKTAFHQACYFYFKGRSCHPRKSKRLQKRKQYAYPECTAKRRYRLLHAILPWLQRSGRYPFAEIH